MKKLNLTILLVCFLSTTTFAQSADSKGTSFWFSFMENLTLVFNGDPQFTVLVDSDTNGSAVIEAVATGLTFEFDYAADAVTSFDLPPAIYYAQGSEDVENFGFQLRTTTEVRANAVHFRIYFTEASIVLSEENLGSDYIVVAAQDELESIDAPSSFVIVATQDQTIVEITPSENTAGFRPKGIPFTVEMNAGESYQVQATGDLTGSSISSADNKKIAVFSGALKALISCTSADNHIYDQLPPLSYAGKTFGLIPFTGQDFSLVKIVATEDDTAIDIDEVNVATLNKGEFYTYELSEAQILTTKKPVLVAQFTISGNCGMQGSNGDPNMLILTPIDYTIRKTRLKAIKGFSDDFIAFSSNHTNLVSRTNTNAAVTVNGTNPVWTAFPSKPEYSYARVEITDGDALVEAPFGVNCYTYGLGDFDAYTYHGGFNESMTTSADNTDVDFSSLVFPNPASDYIDLTNLEQGSTLSILNTTGQGLLKTDIQRNNTNLDISSIPPGTYIIRIQKGHTLVSSIIIKI